MSCGMLSHFVVEEVLEQRVESRLTALLYPRDLTPAENM